MTLFCERQNMLALEVFTPIHWEHFTDINLKMRYVLAGWMIEVSKAFKFMPYTASLGIIILDRFLGVCSQTRRLVCKNQLQLYGCVSFFLASKILDVYPVEPDDFVFISANTFTIDQIYRAEEDIFKTLQGRINSTNHAQFINVLSYNSNANAKTHSITQLICDISFLSASSKYPASIVATASHVIAHKLNHQTPHNYFGVDVPTLKCCVTTIVSDILFHKKVLGTVEADYNLVISEVEKYQKDGVITCGIFVPEGFEASPIDPPPCHLIREDLIFVKKEEISKINAVYYKIGQGTFGKVYRVLLNNNETYAYKKVNSYDPGLSVSFLRECSGLLLKHENIVKLYGFVGFDSLLLEYMDMDLEKYYKSRIPTTPLIASICDQLLEGLSFLESVGVIHRDIKPQNILVSTREAQLKLKYADFGLARSFVLPITVTPFATNVFTTNVCTLWYKAPELLLGMNIYSHNVDVWSLGCVLGEVFMKQALFQGTSEIDQLYRIFRRLGTPTDETWNKFSELPEYKPTFPKWQTGEVWNFLGKSDHIPSKIKSMISNALTQDPAKRPSAKELKKQIN